VRTGSTNAAAKIPQAAPSAVSSTRSTSTEKL
jgi:hypothetical protein